MAIEHAKPGQAIDLATHFADAKTTALVKTDDFEVIRVALAAGGKLPPHKVDGPITVQCLSGQCTFFVGESPREMTAGTWLYLSGGTMHTVEAETAAEILVTIMFQRN